MKKWLLTVIIGVMAVCVVLGLPDRMTYEGTQYAIGMLEGTTEDIRTDVETFKFLFAVIENFDPEKDQSIMSFNDVITQNQYQGTVVRWGSADNQEAIFRSTARIDTTVVGLAERFTHDSTTGFLGETVRWVALFTQYIPAFISSAIHMLGDFIGTAWSIVQACFYLLGF